MLGYKKRIMVHIMCICICLLMIFTELKVKASGNVIYNGPVSYGYSTVGDFTVNGNMAFCFEHEKPTPPTGTAFRESVHDSKDLGKALYYGWGGPGQWGGFESQEHGIVATSLVASHYYSGTRIYTDGQSYYNWLSSQPDVPPGDMSLSATYTESYLTADKTRQRTDNLTLYAEAGNKITINLPGGISLYNVTRGTESSGSADISGGETFYLTAPLTMNGTWDSGKLKSSVGKYQAVIAATEESVQDLGYGQRRLYEDQAVEFSVKWIQRGDVCIYKFLETDQEIKTPAAGAQFTFTHQDTGEQVTVTADDSGRATTEDRDHYPAGRLLGGKWLVEETVAPEGYKAMDPFFATVTGQGQVFTFIAEDKAIRGAIQVEKLDQSTDKRVAMAGATFKIVNRDTGEDIKWNALSPEVTTFTEFTTDTAGQYTLPERLPCGNYQLVEVAAPNGYLINMEPIAFTIDEDYAWDMPLTVTSTDENVMGNIKITKTDSEDERALQGAVYEITAGEDIVTNDGTVRAGAGDIVDTVTTDEQGQAVSKELYLGKYTVQEIQAPLGYVKDNTQYQAELLYADQNTPVVTARLDLTDQPTQFTLRKTDAGTKEPMPGVEYQMWNQAFDVEDADDKMSVKETLTTDEAGEITVKYLPKGVYCIQETKTLQGYVLDPAVYEVTVDENGLTPDLVDGALELSNDYTKVYISKKDSNHKKELPGAKLQIKDKDDKVVEEWTSQQVPHLTERMPAGEYTLTETAAPQGYDKAKDVKFTVKETSEVQTVEMFDRLTPVIQERKSVKTGDDSFVLYWAAAAAAGAFGVAVILYLRSRRPGRR